MSGREPEEAPLRTMMITVSIALLCSAMVSGAVLWLRPLQAVYAAADRNAAILAAAGRLPANRDERSLGEAFLDLNAAIVDLTDGHLVEPFDPYVFDHWSEPDLEQLDSGRGAGVGLPSLPRFAPVYRVIEGERAALTILPMHGQGMWSTLYAYLALDRDLQRVAALVVHRHGETPGIGDRIQDPAWLESWQGKRLYDAGGVLALQVSQDPALAAEHRVDAISGATVTSLAVGRMVRFWLGPQGYGALLERLAAERDNSDGATP